jgi:hypothetical protein
VLTLFSSDRFVGKSCVICPRTFWTTSDTNSNHLRFWRLETWNDGSIWVRTNNQSNDGSLNSNGAISIFSLSNNWILTDGKRE